MLIVSFLIGCFSVCESPIHGISSTKEIYEVCSIPDEQTEIECLADIKADSVTDRATLYKACGLDSFIDETKFLFAKDNMLKATKAILYLNKKNVEGATALFNNVTAESIYRTDLSYVQNSRGESPVVPENTELTTNVMAIEGLGTGGEFELWGAKTPLQSPWIVVDDTLNLQTIRHHLSRKDTESLHFVFQDKGLHYITLHQPSRGPVEDLFWENNALSEVKGEASRLLLHAPSATKLIDILPSLSNIKQDVELAITSHPCTSISGMECHEGSSSMHTYYIDQVNNDYSCVEPAICRATKGTWLHANQTCRSHGKRLPTLEEAQDSKISQVFWTSEWSKKDSEGKTVCGDLFPCRKANPMKFLSNGSELFPSSLNNGPIVCALDYPARFATKENPSFSFALKDITIPALTPNPELAEIARTTIRHDDLEDKGICGEDVRERWIESLRKAGGGRSTTQCRDPFSYVTPNEPLRYIWAPYFNNIGGGYAGVGSDQNYDFISVAKSTWAWLYDYDPNVYRLHKILKPMILKAESPDEFLALFEDGNIGTTTDLIANYYKDESSIDQNKLIRFFTGYRHKLRTHYHRSKIGIKEMPSFGWLANPDNYAYIRTMHQQNRIIPVAGDMLASNGLRSIGDAAKKMNIPIRIFYTSNAPTAWGGAITNAYKLNVTNFPFDRKSVVLTTFNSGGFNQTGYWHHNIANGLLMQERIGSGYYINQHLSWDRLPTRHEDMTTTALLTNVFEE